MKRMVILFCVLSIMLAPVISYADDAAVATTTTTGKPVQVLKHDYVVPMLQEPAGVTWSSGEGRKDGVLEWAVDDNYLKKTPAMFLRGFSNAGFGWAEILTHPVRWSRNAPLGIGTLTGLIVGPVMAVLRTTSGAIDLATCWVPFWYGVPMGKPALGLHDVHHFGTIDDVDQYHHDTKRYLFDKLSDEY